MRAALLFLAILLPIASPLPLQKRGISESTGVVPNSEQDDTNVSSVDTSAFHPCLQQSETQCKWIHVAAALLQGFLKKIPFSCVTEWCCPNGEDLEEEFNSETLALLSTVHGDIEGGWVDEQSQETRDSTILAGLDELAVLQKIEDDLKVALDELVAQWCSPNKQSQESPAFVDEHRDEVLKSEVQGDELKSAVEYRQVNGDHKGGLDNEQSQETCDFSNRAVLEQLDELQMRLNKRFEELLEWDKRFLEWEKQAISACSRVQSRVLRINDAPKFRENGSARLHRELANTNNRWHALLNDKEGIFATLAKQQADISNIRLNALLKDKKGEFAELHNEQADKNDCLEELVQYQSDIDYQTEREMISVLEYRSVP